MSDYQYLTVETEGCQGVACGVRRIWWARYDSRSVGKDNPLLVITRCGRKILLKYVTAFDASKPVQCLACMGERSSLWA